MATDRQTRVVWLVTRFVLGAGSAAFLAYAALALTFVGAITFTGCFLTCEDPNPALGSFAIAGAVLAGSGAVTALVAGFAGKNAPLRRVFRFSAMSCGALAFFGLIVLASAA